MLKHRYAEIDPSSYPLTDASGDLSSGAKGKQPLREGEEVTSETDYFSPAYNGTIVLTPKNRQHQMILSICLPPRISFRTTIPSTSQIFEAAAFGTLDEIREILDSRTESWNVCDEYGRSLFNVSSLHYSCDEILMIFKYAAATLNMPNCKYLLNFVEDVDTTEPVLRLPRSGPIEEWSLEHQPDILMV